MKKIFSVVIILAAFAIAMPAKASWQDSSFVATVLKIAENILSTEETPAVLPPEQDVFEEEFVDPKEIQQVLREMKDMRRELNSFIKQLKKIANAGDDINQINSLLQQIAGFESAINAGTNLRDTIQEFRDLRIWEELNKFRAKIEIPRETSQWNKEIKKLEKMLIQKKYQNLGFNFDAVRAKVGEIKSGVARVLELYNSGNLEEAIEEFNDLRQDFHPGEITSVIQRVQEITNRLKSVKNAEAREKIKAIFGEAISNFNEGEYRIARELIDESFNDIAGMISKASLIGKKKGYSKDQILQMTEQLKEKVQGRVEEKTMRIQEEQVKREMMEKREPVIEKREPAPAQIQEAPVPSTPVEPAPRVEQQPVQTAPVQ